MFKSASASLVIAAVFLMCACTPAQPSPTSTPTPIPPTVTPIRAELQLFTEEYPPVTFSQNGFATGLGTEIVEEIMRRQKVAVTIQVQPWARGYQTALEGPMTGLFATMRTDEREKLFKWVGPLTQVNTSFYVLKGSPIKITSLEDAKKLESIGVPREYYSDQYLIQQGFTNLDESVDPKSMVNKMLSGRNPVMVNDNITLAELLRQNDATLDDVEQAYTFMTSQNYLAFSLDTPDDLVQSWQAALDEMRADGTIAKLYEKWLPGEVPPATNTPHP